MLPTAEQLPADAPQLSAVESVTTATLPPETARLLVPVASGVGSAAPAAPPEASWTRKRPPGAIDPLSAVGCHVEPALVAYWTVQPSTVTAAEPALKSST
jgi:hypothetical protein